MTQDEKEKFIANVLNAPFKTSKNGDAISAAFADMAMHGRGFTRMTAEGIEHVPYHDLFMKSVGRAERPRSRLRK